MKRILMLTSFLTLTLFVSAFGQSNQSPEMQQSTSTTNTRQANPPKPKLQKSNRRNGMSIDTTPSRNRNQRRLRPDSLRRGGATRVDTVR